MTQQRQRIRAVARGREGLGAGGRGANGKGVGDAGRQNVAKNDMENPPKNDSKRNKMLLSTNKYTERKSKD